MDGVYCPQLTVGAPIVKALGPALLRDVHLMVDDPLAKIEPILAAGADIVTVHIERAGHPHRVFTALPRAPRPGRLRPPARPRDRPQPEPAGRGDRAVPRRAGVRPGAGDRPGLGRPGLHPRHDRPDRARPRADRRNPAGAIALGVDGGVTMANVSRPHGPGPRRDRHRQRRLRRQGRRGERPPDARACRRPLSRLRGAFERGRNFGRLSLADALRPGRAGFRPPDPPCGPDPCVAAGLAEPSGTPDAQFPR